MSTARKAKTVAYVSGGFLALTAVVGGAAVALTHTSAPQAATPPARVEAGTTSPSSAPIAAKPAATAAARKATPPTPAATVASLYVAPLRKLTPPDAVVTVHHAVSRRQVALLRQQTGIHLVSVADRGSVRLHGVTLRVLGVSLTSIRGFLPSLTASSTPLWQSVARGELTISYAKSRHLRRHLGSTFVATGQNAKVAPLRVGAFATIGLTDTQALLSQPAAHRLGLAPRREVMIAAPKLSLDALTADVKKSLGAAAHIDVTRAAPVDQSVLSSYAQTTIPASYLDLYRRAAVTCPGLPWTVLAGIGTVETGNGRDVHKSTAGAEGPMQFIPSTWAMYGYDADGDGKADINDPTDAVFSAARYLCAAGAGRGGQSLDNAIFSYNHAWWYVREVIVIANQYA
jgi:hypothetical protein